MRRSFYCRTRGRSGVRRASGFRTGGPWVLSGQLRRHSIRTAGFSMRGVPIFSQRFYAGHAFPKGAKRFFRFSLFFIFTTMTNKNSSRHLFRSLYGVVRIRGTRFLNRNNGNIIILRRRLNYTISTLNISVVSRDTTNLLLRRYQRMQ